MLLVCLLQAAFKLGFASSQAPYLLVCCIQLSLKGCCLLL
jgi:hypothetical protein